MKLNKKRKELFIEVTQAIGVSGNERSVLKVLQKHYQDLCDEIIYDNLGSIIGIKKSKVKDAPKVLLLGHMDEVGFIVKKVTENGSLKIHPLGSSWEQTLLSHRVKVVAKDDKIYDGVIGAIPPHLLSQEMRDKPMKIENMLVDIGAKSEEEVIKLGINIGSPIIVDGPLVELNEGKRLLSKAFDDRYGLIMGIELLQALKDEELNVDLYVGGSVQEEVGLRGATTVANLVNPDFAIILDCSPANDLGGSSENGQLGEGVLIRYVDGSMIAFPQLLDYQIAKCVENKVKYQYYSSPGGTDAGAVHKSNNGVLTLTQCICARNIHSSGSVIDLEDYEGSKKVLLSMLRTLTKEKIEEFKLLSR